MKPRSDSGLSAFRDRMISILEEAGLAGTTCKPASNLSSADLDFQVGTGQEKTRLLVAVRKNLEPRQIRATLFDLEQLLPHHRGSHAVICGHYIPESSRELCRTANIGFLDLMGNAWLRFGNVLIDRRTPERPPAEERPLRSLFSWKSSRVVRLLLSQPRKDFQVQQLAARCRISLGLAWKVKDRLVALDYVRHTRDGVRVVRPEALLRDWASHYTWSCHEGDYFWSPRPVAEMEAALSRLCVSRSIPFGLTLLSGAARRAPMVPHYPQGSAYVDAAPATLDVLVGELGWKPVPGGAVFTVLKPKDESVLWDVRRGTGAERIVSDLQLFLDLSSYRGRGEEAAGAILEQRLRPAW